MKRLFRAALIASEYSPALRPADVLVEGDRIIGVADSISDASPDEIIDCQGQVLLPSLFDLHVHAREPGGEHKENILTCSEAAINGGITGIVLQPNTQPAIDSAAAVQNVLDIAREKSRIWPTLFTSGAITKGRQGTELAAIAGMKGRGAVMLTDDGDPVSNPQVLRRAMEYAKQFDMPIASHCEVKELSGKGSMHEGSVSYSLGLQGIPSISEEIGIARDIRIAEYVGVHLHVQHVSTEPGMDTLRRAKERGIRVSCEVSPHHLLFNHEHVGNYDTHFKMNPPLRTPQDNAALLQGLIDGVFDVIATDHAPHTEFEKNQDFASAPFGITGLETALPSLYHHFIAKQSFGWNVLVKHFANEPRRLLKLPTTEIREGNLAEFILFDPTRRSCFTRDFMRSKSVNTPFYRQTLQGLVSRVVYRGADLLAR